VVVLVFFFTFFFDRFTAIFDIVPLIINLSFEVGDVFVDFTTFCI